MVESKEELIAKLGKLMKQKLMIMRCIACKKEIITAYKVQKLFKGSKMEITVASTFYCNEICKDKVFANIHKAIKERKK